MPRPWRSATGRLRRPSLVPPGYPSEARSAKDTGESPEPWSGVEAVVARTGPHPVPDRPADRPQESLALQGEYQPPEVRPPLGERTAQGAREGRQRGPLYGTRPPKTRGDPQGAPTP